MMNFFHQLKRQSITGAIITIVLGLVLIFAPGSLLGLVLGLVGWVLIICGVLSIISFVLNRGLGGSYSQLIFGLAQLLFGLWIVRNPSGLVSLVATVVGILLLIHGFSDLQYTVSAYRAGAANWWTAAISGGITLALALLVFFQPVSSTLTLASIAGICLVVDGVCDLVMIHRLSDYFQH